jgi:hypothetical protein
MLGLACCWSGAAPAQLQLLPGNEPQQVFAGEARKIAVIWHNPGEKAIEASLRTRLFQTSSATAVRLSESPWKKLQVLPGQTVMESAALDFPAVKAETPFLVQWLEGTNRVPGKTEVLVYPPDLLKELKPLTEDEPLGVFDPNNQLKPLLKNVKADFMDLEDAGLDGFRGKLAIVGPFQSKTQMREGLAAQIQKLASKGVAVVWIQPPPEPRDPIKPSFYTVPEGKGAVVVVQGGLFSNLPENPQAQLNLIYFCKLALNPESPRLPGLTTTQP